MAAKKIAFTEKRVSAFECPATRRATRGARKGELVPVDYALFWDKEVPGLGLRVVSTGVRSYIFEKRIHSVTRRVTIGDPDSWKLDDARKRARYLATLIDRNIDPKTEAAAERAKAEALRLESQRHGHMVAVVWQAYIDANKAGWGERHLADHESLAHGGGAKKKRGKGLTKPGPLAALMSRKLSELTSETVAEWLKREGKKRPTSAAGAYRLLRAFCSWTQEKPEKGQPDYRHIVALDACRAKEVTKVLPVSKPKKDDSLKRGELAAWFKAVRGLGNPVIAAFLQCLLLTGARREEMGRLKWSDVKSSGDEWASLVLRDKVDKVDGTRTIPLTPFVASLLKPLPQRNQWVFSSLTAKAGRLVEPTKAHNDALAAAGIRHVSLHGLRRSFATMPDYMDDMPAGVIAQIMGHKPSATAEKHYKQRQLDQLHKWHAKLEAWILAEAGISFTPQKEAARRAA